MKRPGSCLPRCGIILFWLAIWQLAAAAVGNQILFVGPVQVLAALIHLLPSPDFWKTVICSFAKISLGFLLAFLSGIILGTAAWRFSLIRDFLSPVISLTKSVPVASFVILALIWIGSKNLSVIISFTVVLPMIYSGTVSGLSSTDLRLMEMAAVFRMPLLKRIRYLYIPALIPYLVSSCRTALGISWKSGIAAEVIGTPAFSIGRQLYNAKISLETERLFAWTIVIILASTIFEHIFLWLLRSVPCGAKTGKGGSSWIRLP